MTHLRGVSTANTLLQALESRSPLSLVAGGEPGGLPPGLAPFHANRRWMRPRLDDLHQALASLPIESRAARHPLPLNAAIVSYYLDGTHGADLEAAVLLESPGFLLAIRSDILARQPAPSSFREVFANPASSRHDACARPACWSRRLQTRIARPWSRPPAKWRSCC
jgi:hypothetical protein